MQHKAAVDCMGGLIKRQTRAHGGGEGVHPLRLQVQMRHRAQRLHFHRTAQRDIVGAAAGNFLCCRAAGRQRVVQVDIDFQAFCADGNLFHFLCGGDPSFGQQPPQRQLRQKLGCAYYPEGRLFIYIDNCGVFCWNGRFRAVRHPDGFKGGCCAEEVDSLHGGPFSVKAAVQVLLSAGRKFPKGLRVKEKRQPF